MFTSAAIQKMKQSNISVDGEKTKRHLSLCWKAASKKDQETIMELAGVARSTIHRAYRTGGVSAKLAVAMAQTLNIDPFYLTGASDQPGSCTDELMLLFLQTHNYAALMSGWSAAPRRQLQTAPSPAEAIPAPAAFAAMSEEDLIILLRSLLIKARADARSAQQLLKLKQLLLS
jgi:hypothetical protein